MLGIDIAYQRKKFDCGFSFSPFRDDLSSVSCKTGLATVKLSIKFAVSTSTHYEDMKMDRKCGKWGGLG